MLRTLLAVSVLMVIASDAMSESGLTLDAIKQRGAISCGVTDGIKGFSAPDKNGKWAGLDVDFCRALAAAIFNDAAKVKFVPLAAKDRLSSLKSGVVDILSAGSVWQLSDDVPNGIEHVGITFYDGQGFMVPKALQIDSVQRLNGASICVLSGSPEERALAQYFKLAKLPDSAVPFSSGDDILQAYSDGKCNAISDDVSELYFDRLKLAQSYDNVVLPEVISKKPRGPAVLQDATQWLAIVRWSLYAMLQAEELNVSSETIKDAIKSTEPGIKLLLGTDGSFGPELGLTNDWVVRIVTLVGNYGEIFENDLGVKSQIGMARGLNWLWT